MPPTFRVGLPVSVKPVWKYLYRYTHRCISTVVLNSILLNKNELVHAIKLMTQNIRNVFSHLLEVIKKNQGTSLPIVSLQTFASPASGA